MKIPGKAIIIAVLMLAGQPLSADQGAYEDMFEMVFEIDLKRDARIAREQGRHLMIMFVKDGCSPCAKMKATVLRDPAVRAFYRQHFFSYHVNIFGDLPVIDSGGEKLSEKTFARRYGIWGTPTFWFFNGEGRLIYRHTGFIATRDFLKLGEYIDSRKYLAEKTAGYRPGWPYVFAGAR